MFTWGFSRQGFPGLELRLEVLAVQGMKVGREKISLQSNLQYLVYRSIKLHDPMFLSFDALPACDGQTDTPPI